MKKKNKHSKFDKVKYFNHRQPWTNEEDELLERLSLVLPDEEISIRLGRTLASIWKRRMVLGGEGDGEITNSAEQAREQS